MYPEKGTKRGQGLRSEEEVEMSNCFVHWIVQPRVGFERAQRGWKYCIELEILAEKALQRMIWGEEYGKFREQKQ